MASIERIHLRLYGGVQGVGFRMFARRAALQLGLAGYVRNCTDGSVELEAEGDQAGVRQFRAVVEAGPAHASVRRVVEAAPGPGVLPRPFEIRR